MAFGSPEIAEGDTEPVTDAGHATTGDDLESSPANPQEVAQGETMTGRTCSNGLGINPPFQAASGRGVGGWFTRRPHERCF
jgi:hypothetical protein